MDEKIKKLEELFKDSELFEKVFSGDPDQVLANLAAQGIEMTKEELRELSAGVLKGTAELAEGELSEEDLAEVAGGKKAKKKKVNIGFFNGLFDACDDDIFGTHKGADAPAGPLYALGYSIGFGLTKLMKG